MEPLLELTGEELVEVVFQGRNYKVPLSLLITPGPTGKSAYELAVDNGFVGDLTAWLTSLAGQDGNDGQDGANGKSTYELAVEAGFQGDVIDWLASLKGQDGQDGINGTPWHLVTDDVENISANDDEFAYDPATKTLYLRIEGTWVLQGSIRTQTDPEGTVAHVRVGDTWVPLDRYDLKAAPVADIFDLAEQQVFILDGTLDHVIEFINPPQVNRAIPVLIQIKGAGGSITWPTGIQWNKNAAPTLSPLFTNVALLWNGESWSGGVSMSA